MKDYCYKVTCNCTNSSKHAVSTGDYEDSTANHDYLDCEDGILYVKASSISAVEKLIGPNIQHIEKLGLCY